MRAQEGDLIKTQTGTFFDVKGQIHPQTKIIAFPRFIPSPDGTRKNKDNRYGKVYSLDERFNYLEKNHPDLIVYDEVFGETLCEVPHNQIIKHYHPPDKLIQLRHAKNLTPLEEKALNLAEELKHNANLPWSNIGISGSIMAGLTTSTSDIDPIVYGAENSHKAYSTLQELQKTSQSGFKPYTTAELKTLYDFRFKDTQMSFNDFSAVESRKVFQGMYQGTDYFIRFIKEQTNPPQQYGDIFYQNSGYSRICSTITDAQDALYTPCTYKLGDVQILEGSQIAPIEEVVSFRGRFCMQAKIGERIEAKGKIERTINKKTNKEHYRLILGNKPQDYLILLR